MASSEDLTYENEVTYDMDDRGKNDLTRQIEELKKENEKQTDFEKETYNKEERGTMLHGWPLVFGNMLFQSQ